MPRYEILSPDAIATLDKGWRRIVSEIGVEFAKPEALELFREAGQRSTARPCSLDPDFVLEQVAKAPREFDVQARNPAQQRAHRRRRHGLRRGLRVARSCARATCAATRRWTTSAGCAMLAQSFPQLDSAGGVICEPNDAPLDSRHLDMIYALQTLTDKIYMGNVVSGPNAADTIAMTEILFGGREPRSSPRRPRSR